MTQTHGPSTPPSLGLVRSTLVAFVVLIVANAVALALDHSGEAWTARGLHHLYQAGRHLAAALVVVAIIWGCARVPALRGRGGYLVLGGASLLVGAFTLVEDASGFAGSLLPSAPAVALWVLIVIVAGSVVAAAVIGHWMDRPRWRWAAVAAGLAGLLVHPHVLENTYPAAHLYLASSCVALIATALHHARLPARWAVLQTALPWALAGLVAAFSVGVPPSNSLQLDLLRTEADVVSPYLARRAESGTDATAALPKQWAPWFEDRSNHPPIAPTKPALAPDDAVVILLTIDSLRADVLADAKTAKRFPNLQALRRRSVYFENARTPGSETVTTLSSLFLGTYYSQQYWSGHEGSRGLWPDDDDSVRFPQLLSKAGIATVNYGTAKWLVNEYGITRGFTEEGYVKPAKTHFSLTTETFPKLFERLARHEGGPMFVYSHVLDAHLSCRPIKKGKGKGRYLANLEAVDEQIGLLVAEVERLGLADRTYFIISSDHGEAFGEHGTHQHKSTLYEELLRVPLMIAGPNIERRTVKAPVGIIDLGPTILDLFGQETPGHFMGQSLVPFLSGGKRELTRPLLAEGLLKKALLFPDRTKVIVDDKNHTAEVYDLASDPGEESNLVDLGSAKAKEQIAVLRKFFDVHTLQRDGYKPPYRS